MNIQYMTLLEAITDQAIQDYIHYKRLDSRRCLNPIEKHDFTTAKQWLFDFIPQYCGCTKQDVKKGLEKRYGKKQVKPRADKGRKHGTI